MFGAFTSHNRRAKKGESELPLDRLCAMCLHVGPHTTLWADGVTPAHGWGYQAHGEVSYVFCLPDSTVQPLCTTPSCLHTGGLETVTDNRITEQTLAAVAYFTHGHKRSNVILHNSKGRNSNFKLTHKRIKPQPLPLDSSTARFQSQAKKGGSLSSLPS